MVIKSHALQLIPSRSETPFSGLVVDWYYDGDVIVYKVTNLNEDILQKWANYTHKIIANWDHSKPYLAVHDLSHQGVSLPYAVLTNFDMMNIGIAPDGRAIAESYFDQTPDWHARIAVNFNLTLSGQTNRTLMNRLGRLHPAIQYKTFYHRARCIDWLTTGITETNDIDAVDSDD